MSTQHNDTAKEQAREAAVKEIVRIAQQNHSTFREGAYLGYEAGYRDALAEQWFDIGDRLPDNDDPVLTTVDSAYNHERRMYQIIIQSYCEGEWETQDVTAWKPLPKPYGESL